MNRNDENKTDEMTSVSTTSSDAGECRSTEFGHGQGESENASIDCNPLYPVNNLPEKYRHIFSNYTYFNKMQTKVIETIFHTNKSIVVSSPTGSGKTVIFELAIINFLETFKMLFNSVAESKIVYVAPIKALCSERYKDWKNKFSVHGLKCIEITGDTELSDDKYLINNYQLIITTPEKWDSVTRKFKEFKCQLCMIKLFLIDEVHLINEGVRGATLETIISRMKIIPKINTFNDFTLRFVAVSATVSNIEDIAEWLSLDQNNSAYYLKSDEDERPVKLQKIVLGFNANSNGFKFELDLSYKLKPLIKQYSYGRPTLIFCSTRKSVEITCSILMKNVVTPLFENKQKRIDEMSKEINNSKIKEWIKLGIGCHHAGMSFPERSAVENLFRNGYLDVLVATSTLAMGINLPVHLVIIKSTEYYTFNGYKEYSQCQVLQMIGRAGRPQFDSTATAIIMTKNSMKSHYEKILVGDQFVESHLHKYLIEHLNAEIFFGTIRDATVATDWIRSTFLYVRACKSPRNYGMTKTGDVGEIERRLQDLCLKEIKSLACTGLIKFLGDNNNKITLKPEGEIMAKYSISFATMKLYMDLKGTESLNDVIKVLVRSKEFENIKLRRTEKVKLNSLNKTKLSSDAVIRFPIVEGINTNENKINCLLQATLGTLKITDSSLAQDASKIILISSRLTKALREITCSGTNFKVARVACVLAKCVATKLWEQSKFVSKLIPKVGPVLSSHFVSNGKTTLQSILDTHPRDLERLLNRNPPFGDHVHDFIRQIPKYKLLMSIDGRSESIVLNVILIGSGNISENVRFHTVSIVVGDSENRLLKARQIRNKEFSENVGGDGVVKLTVSLRNQQQFFSNKPDYTITACLISDQWIGTDVEIDLRPADRGTRTKESTSDASGVRCCDESPLTSNISCSSSNNNLTPSPQQQQQQQKRQIKKRTTTTARRNQTKKDKTQINIDKYFRNVSAVAKRVVDKSPVVEDQQQRQDGVAYGADVDETGVAAVVVTDEETRGGGLNENDAKSGRTNEYFDEFDIDDLDGYENDTLFKRRSKDGVLMENSNESMGTNDDRQHVVGHGYSAATISLDKSDQIAREIVIDRYCDKQDRLENKENVNPCKSPKRLKKRLPYDVLQEGLANKRLLQKSPNAAASTTRANKFVMKKSVFDVVDNRSTNVLARRPVRRNVFSTNAFTASSSSCRPLQCSGNDGAVPRNERKSLPVGKSLSQRIDNNLKAPVAFHSDAVKFISKTADGRFPAAAPSSSSAAIVVRTTGRVRSGGGGNATMDEYYGATKSSRRSVRDDSGGNATKIDHGFDQADSEESHTIAGRQYKRYYFPPMDSP